MTRRELWRRAVPRWAPGLPVLMVSLALVSACAGGSSPASSNGANAAAQAAAKSITDKYLSVPTSIGVTAPLSARPPTGKTFAFVFPNNSLALAYADDFAAPAKALGWKVAFFEYTPTPEDTLTELQAAIASKPAGIGVLAVPGSTIVAAAKQIVAAKVPIVGVSFLDNDVKEVKAAIGNLLVANFSTESQEKQLGYALGSWIASDSQGKADVLNVTEPEFQILSDADTPGIIDGVKSHCPKCKVTTLNVDPSAAGSSLPAEIVSTLQTNPSINYVCLNDGSLDLGVVAAIREADLENKVKIVGTGVTTQVAAEIVDGTEYGWGYSPQKTEVYGNLDALARYLMGDPTQNYGLVSLIVTKDYFGSNPTASSISQDLADVPANLAEQWYKLWHVQ